LWQKYKSFLDLTPNPSPKERGEASVNRNAVLRTIKFQPPLQRRARRYGISQCFVPWLSLSERVGVRSHSGQVKRKPQVSLGPYMI